MNLYCLLIIELSNLLNQMHVLSMYVVGALLSRIGNAYCKNI